MGFGLISHIFVFSFFFSFLIIYFFMQWVVILGVDIAEISSYLEMLNMKTLTKSFCDNLACITWSLANLYNGRQLKNCAIFN